MHGRPTAEELVIAVREFLERDVMTATEGRVQFHTRVAINALGMVERELGREPVAAERATAQAAVADLAARIRDGSLDGRLDEVRAEVRASVRAKLLISNPYLLPMIGLITGSSAFPTSLYRDATSSAGIFSQRGFRRTK